MSRASCCKGLGCCSCTSSLSGTSEDASMMFLLQMREVRRVAGDMVYKGYEVTVVLSHNSALSVQVPPKQNHLAPPPRRALSLHSHPAVKCREVNQ
jgi:hypothetical protein